MLIALTILYAALVLWGSYTRNTAHKVMLSLIILGFTPVLLVLCLIGGWAFEAGFLTAALVNMYTAFVQALLKKVDA